MRKFIPAALIACLGVVASGVCVPAKAGVVVSVGPLPVVVAPAPWVAPGPYYYGGPRYYHPGYVRYGYGPYGYRYGFHGGYGFRAGYGYRGGYFHGHPWR